MKKPLFVHMLKAQQLIVIITATIVTDYTFSLFLTQIEEIMQNKKRKLKNTSRVQWPIIKSTSESLRAILFDLGAWLAVGPV